MKSMTTMRTILGLAVFTAVGLAGCVDGDSTTSEGGAPLPAPLASAVNDDGTEVAVYELGPGTLIAVVNGELPAGVDHLRPLELFEAVAGQPAPAIVRDTQARIAAARAAHPDDVDPAPVAVRAPDRAPIANLTGADFSAGFCNPGVVDFDQCWLNRTNDWSTQINSVDWIHSHANRCGGNTVTHRMQYKNPPFGAWNVINADSLVDNTTVSTFSETDNGNYIVEILNASGDCWHLSIHGDQ